MALAACAAVVVTVDAGIPEERARVEWAVVTYPGVVKLVFSGSATDAIDRIEVERRGSGVHVEVIVAPSGNRDLSTTCVGVRLSPGAIRRVTTGDPARTVRRVRSRPRTRAERRAERMCRYVPVLLPAP